MEKLKKYKKITFPFKTLPVFLSVLYFILPAGFAHAGLAERIGSAISSAFASIADFFLGNLFEGLAWVVELVASLFASLGSQFLDAAIRYAINGDNLQITGIILGWEIFRDLVNMIFIFILLYIAIMTILQASSFNTRKILANLVIVGLLVNFSFFLTGFVIDIGNSLAVNIYDSMTPGGSSVGGILTDRMNLSQLKDAAENESNFMMGAMHLLNALFFFVSAFVFFAGGFLFIIRHVTLLFVLMLSPIAFAAYILDKSRPQFQKWLSHLLGSTFVAPAYLLLIAVTVAIASAGGLIQGSQVDNLQVGASGNLTAPFIDKPGLLLNYIVIIFLMAASLTVAKNISGSIGGAASRWAGKAAFGGAGILGRHTLGRAANALGKSEWLKEKAATSRIAQYGQRAAMRTAGFSYDARGGPIGSTLKSVGGIDTGRATGKGGYAKIEKDRIKRQEEISKAVSTPTITNKEYRAVEKDIKQEERGIKAEIKKVKAQKKQASGAQKTQFAQEEARLRQKLQEQRAAVPEKRSAAIKKAQETAEDRAFGTIKRTTGNEYLDEKGNVTTDINKAARKYKMVAKKNADGLYVDENDFVILDQDPAKAAQVRSSEFEYVKAKAGQMLDKKGNVTTERGKADRYSDGRKDTHLRTIETPTILERISGLTTAHREAAAKIRKGKGTKDKIKDLAKNEGLLDDDTATDTVEEAGADIGGGDQTNTQSNNQQQT